MSIKPVSCQRLESGELSVSGVPVSRLVAEHGTSLYVMDGETLRKNCLEYLDAFKSDYPNAVVAYASKSLLTVGVARFMANLGMGFDVCSGGEIYTILQAGVDCETVYFHGNNKSIAELELAVAHNIRIMLDNEQELQNIQKIVEETGATARILVRLKPEIEAHTHEYIKTGQIDSKFGIDKQDLMRVIGNIVAHPNTEFMGIHAHIGSQIFDVDPYHDLVDMMVTYMATIQSDLGVAVQELDLGGGFGIQYVESDDPPDIPVVLEKMVQDLKKACEERGLALPKLIVEPGRSIAATAGLTLYTVGTIKSIPGIKEYIFVDGGMADNPRPIMYQSEYTFELGNKVSNGNDRQYSIAGKFCESGDVLAHNVALPEVLVGDTLVVYGTGAYNYTMSSNYNRFCRPAMVLVDNGQVDVLVKRETYEDLVRLDL